KRIPEEVNKLLTTAAADLYFCPTPTGVKNLAKIGITENVHLVGDVGIDLIFNNLEKIEAIEQKVLQKYGVKPGEYFFVTCHRAANTEVPENLKEILAALQRLPLPHILPMHPRTKKAIQRFGLSMPSGATKPLGFFETQALIRNARMVITDSGGVIKEAYFHQTPGIIIDRQTEWIETIEEGWNHIAGPDCQAIIDVVQNIKMPDVHTNCLGDGTASQKIASIVKGYLEISNPQPTVSKSEKVHV
ncbi:MAG: UDP-N-acetylglucosamine 2-epimerase, partial [Saprospiraceae bacterium]